MKYLKYFEKIKGKNVKIGGIYRINPRETGFLSYQQSKRSLPLAKVTNKLGREYIDMITYVEETGEKWKFNNYNKSNLLNKATPEEIDWFNEYEAREAGEKYNL